MASAAGAVDAERLQRRLDTATRPAQLVAVHHELMMLPSPSAGALEAAAIKLRKFGLLDHAVQLLERARERWPHDHALLRELGFCFRKRGPEGIDQAQHFFEEALHINDADPELHGMVGGMLKRTGRYDDAFEHYKRANDLLPRNLYALVNLGTIEAIRGCYDSATFFYEEVIRHTNHLTLPIDYWDLLCRGEAAVFLVRASTATDAYKDALKCQPPVEDVRSAAEQLTLFIAKNIQPTLAEESARILNTYIGANIAVTGDA